ncbi:MAG: hypothetical protein ABSC45_01900 [Desulfobaccales bacterium]|jgi:hypothetical protein
MIIYVHEGGSDRVELTEALNKEGVLYEERQAETERELGTTSYRLMEIRANLPEVFPVPAEFVQSEGDTRVWRLPSGKMIVSDLDGNLEQIASPLPR